MTQTPINPAVRKAAILLSSLDLETADSLLRQLDPIQAEELHAARRALGEIDPREQERVASEFFSARPGECESEDGDSSHLQTQNDQRTLGILHEPDAARLSLLLEGEHPQTIAIVVSHLPANRAVQVVGKLSGAIQAEVLRRLADLDETHPDVIREIERGLESRIVAESQLLERRSAGLAAVNNILAAADAPAGRQIRRNLAQHDADLARSLAQTPFVFADVAVLDDASLWTLMSAAVPDWIVLALAGAQPELAERVARMLPPDEAADFRQALDELGPTRLSDVEEAQHRIAELARRLELEGELHLVTWRLGSVEV